MEFPSHIEDFGVSISGVTVLCRKKSIVHSKCAEMVDFPEMVTYVCDLTCNKQLLRIFNFLHF